MFVVKYSGFLHVRIPTRVGPSFCRAISPQLEILVKVGREVQREFENNNVIVALA